MMLDLVEVLKIIALLLTFPELRITGGPCSQKVSNKLRRHVWQHFHINGTFVRLSLSEITSLFGLSGYLDRTSRRSKCTTSTVACMTDFVVRNVFGCFRNADSDVCGVVGESEA